MAAVPKTSIIKDTPLCAAAGYIGGTVMEQFNMTTFQRLEPEQDQEREREVRPDMPFNVAARRIAGWLGTELDEEQTQKVGMALHQLLPISWVPVYRACAGAPPCPR